MRFIDSKFSLFEKNIVDKDLPCQTTFTYQIFEVTVSHNHKINRFRCIDFSSRLGSAMSLDPGSDTSSESGPIRMRSLSLASGMMSTVTTVPMMMDHLAVPGMGSVATAPPSGTPPPTVLPSPPNPKLNSRRLSFKYESATPIDSMC